jgi:hypothetical protein
MPEMCDVARIKSKEEEVRQKRNEAKQTELDR